MRVIAPGASWRRVAGVVGRLRWRSLGVLGAWLGWIAGSVLRLRRAHVEAAMRRAGIADCGREARAMYRSLGQSAAEFLWLSVRGREATAHAFVETRSRSLWTEALGRGAGIVIAASHTGNWDLAACAMAQRVELLVVTKRLHAAALDAFWQTTRAAQGVGLTPAEGALLRARQVLGRGGAVAMMIDQAPESRHHAIAVDFLGRSASVDRAPAALAARAGAPLVVTASRRDERGEHVLHVLDVMIPPPRAGRGWIESATRRATLALDRFVRTYPSQWLWLHRRWKAPPGRRTARVDRGEGGARLGLSCAQSP